MAKKLMIALSLLCSAPIYSEDPTIEPTEPTSETKMCPFSNQASCPMNCCFDQDAIAELFARHVTKGHIANLSEEERAKFQEFATQLQQIIKEAQEKIEALVSTYKDTLDRCKEASGINSMKVTWSISAD